MKTIALLFFAGALLIAASQNVSACFCATIGTPQRNLADVDAVFLGKVVAAKRHEWTIAVEETWKGNVQEKVQMRDPSAGTDGESKFTLGETYIFFARAKESGRKTIYRPALCTWTTSLTFRYDGILLSEYVLKELGAGHAPFRRSL